MKVDTLFVGSFRCASLYLLRTQPIENGTLLLRTHCLGGAPVNTIELTDYHNIAHAVTQSVYLSVCLSYVILSYSIHHRDTSRDTSIIHALVISMCALSA